MRRQMGLNLMAALIVSATLAAQAPPAGPGRAGGPPPIGEPGQPRPAGHGPQWLRLLNLTPAQEQAVKAIEDQHQAARAARRQAVMAKGAALRDALEDPAASEAQLKALHAAESDARLQALQEERAAFLETWAVLGKDQQARAQRLRQKFQKEREARRDLQEEIGEPGPGGPGGPCGPGPAPCH